MGGEDKRKRSKDNVDEAGAKRSKVEAREEALGPSSSSDGEAPEQKENEDSPVSPDEDQESPRERRSIGESPEKAPEESPPEEESSPPLIPLPGWAFAKAQLLEQKLHRKTRADEELEEEFPALAVAAENLASAEDGSSTTGKEAGVEDPKTGLGGEDPEGLSSKSLSKEIGAADLVKHFLGTFARTENGAAAPPSATTPDIHEARGQENLSDHELINSVTTPTQAASSSQAKAFKSWHAGLDKLQDLLTNAIPEAREKYFATQENNSAEETCLDSAAGTKNIRPDGADEEAAFGNTKAWSDLYNAGASLLEALATVRREHVKLRSLMRADKEEIEKAVVAGTRMTHLDEAEDFETRQFLQFCLENYTEHPDASPQIPDLLDENTEWPERAKYEQQGLERGTHMYRLFHLAKEFRERQRLEKEANYRRKTCTQQATSFIDMKKQSRSLLARLDELSGACQAALPAGTSSSSSSTGSTITAASTRGAASTPVPKRAAEKCTIGTKRNSTSAEGKISLSTAAPDFLMPGDLRALYQKFKSLELASADDSEMIIRVSAKFEVCSKAVPGQTTTTDAARHKQSSFVVEVLGGSRAPSERYEEVADDETPLVSFRLAAEPAGPVASSTSGNNASRSGSNSSTINTSAPRIVATLEGKYSCEVDLRKWGNAAALTKGGTSSSDKGSVPWIQDLLIGALTPRALITAAKASVLRL